MNFEFDLSLIPFELQGSTEWLLFRGTLDAPIFFSYRGKQTPVDSSGAYGTLKEVCEEFKKGGYDGIAAIQPDGGATPLLARHRPLSPDAGVTLPVMPDLNIGCERISDRQRHHRAAPSWRNHRVVIFAGRYDTRKHDGRDYETVTLGEIFDSADKPACLAKEQAPAFIPSAYSKSDARTHYEQRQHGVFASINGDVDTGDVPFEKLLALTEEFFGGDVAILIYSSSSATNDNRKWRIIVPLDEPLDFARWYEMSEAFFSHMESCGIKMDWALCGAGQPVLLPNVAPEKRGADGQPLFYVHHNRDGRGCRIGDPIAASWIERLRQQRNEEEASKQKTRDEAHKALLGRVDNARPGGSVIDAFNQRHSIGNLLLAFGYTQSPRNDADWRSPYQASGSFATRVFENYWISLSGSDAAAGLGIETKGGFRYGDAFDIYRHFQHAGDYAKAVRSAAHELGITTGTEVQPDLGAMLKKLAGEQTSSATGATVAGTGGTGGNEVIAEVVSVSDCASQCVLEDDAVDTEIIAARMPSIDPIAFYGPLRMIVDAATKNSEATKIGVASTLIAQQSLLLRSFFVPLGDEKPGLNIFVLQVGPSALARKGTSAECANAQIAPRIRKKAAALAERARKRAERVVANEVATAQAFAAHQEAEQMLEWVKEVTESSLQELRSELDKLRTLESTRLSAFSTAKAKREGVFATAGYTRRAKVLFEAEAALDALQTRIVALEERIKIAQEVLQDRDGVEARFQHEIDARKLDLEAAQRRSAQETSGDLQPWEQALAALANKPVVMSGVSSGEGLIYAIRDPGDRPGEDGYIDPGVEEKRLFIDLSEYGSMLSLMRRPGNTLSAIMRDAYDCKPLATNSKNAPVKCDAPYVTMSAAVTPAELCGLLFDKKDAGAQADNGVGNRNLYAFVKREKTVPIPKPTEGVDEFAEILWRNLMKVYRRLNATIKPRSVAYEFDESGEAAWHRVYGPLSSRHGASTNASRLYGRFEINCRKIACILASMNGEAKVSAGAVMAAYAWVTYCADSVDAIASTLEERFKMKRLELHAQKVLDALKELGGEGSLRDVRRKAGLNGAEMSAATRFLLSKAPSPIAIEDKVKPKGNGATQDVAWVRLIE